MAITAEIIDFMQFVPQRVRELQVGDIYINGGTLYLLSNVNGYPIYTRLTELDMTEFTSRDQTVYRLERDLRVTLKPIGEIEQVSPEGNVHGWAVPYGAGHSRIIRQRWALRQKMGDEFSDLFGEPFRPKRMRKATYDRHRARDAELEGRDDSYFVRLMRAF